MLEVILIALITTISDDVTITPILKPVIISENNQNKILSQNHTKEPSKIQNNTIKELNKDIVPQNIVDYNTTIRLVDKSTLENVDTGNLPKPGENLVSKLENNISSKKKVEYIILSDTQNSQNIVVKYPTQHPKVIEKKTVLPKKEFEQKQKSEKTRVFVQVIKGCATVVNTQTCLYARSGANNTTKALHPLRIDTVLEIDPEQTIKNTDGTEWYKIIRGPDDQYPIYTGVQWFIPASYVKLVFIPPEPPVDPTKKIVIDLSEQRLRVYQNNKFIKEIVVSTGLRGDWATPTGKFHIFKKTPSRYMKSAPEENNQYDLPGVPFNMYFTNEGATIHCQYWHDQLGSQYSHGCVNTDCNDARWLYEWTPINTPVFIQQ